MFEPRRFVELRKKPFWQQFLSPESTGMGVFYTLNVFCIQACLSPACDWSDTLDSWCSHLIGMSKLRLAADCVGLTAMQGALLAYFEGARSA